MYITGAKFEDHCSDISGDILNSVFYRFSGTIYDAITSLICIMHIFAFKGITVSNRYETWQAVLYPHACSFDWIFNFGHVTLG